MYKAPLKERLIFMVVVALLAFFFALACTSCASSKSKHSEYQKTDSTHKEQEQTITKVKVDSAATHEKTSEEENSVVIDFGDSQMVVVPKSGKDSGIYFNPNNTNANDYFYWDGTTLISSKVPKKVTIKGSIKKSEKDSAVKSMEALQDHSKIEETAVVTTVKVTDKQKKSFNLLWLLWLLLIPVGYYVYNNRDKIWRWVIKICTGV
jgi:type II secretory pathway pseudopilin PulG